MKIKKINDITIEPIEKKVIDPSKIQGYDYFKRIAQTIFCCAPKNSGKTTVIRQILSTGINKETRVIIFCPTATKDDTWISILEMLDEREINYELHDSIGKNGQDLARIIDELLEPVVEEVEEIQEAHTEIIKYDDTIIELRVKKTPKPKKKKPKKIAPEIFFVLDDLSTEIKSPQISRLLKIHRHIGRSKVLLSSQWILDIRPESHRQLDTILLFKGLSDKRLEDTYLNAGLSVPFQEFEEMYKEATRDKYSFLYIDIPTNEYRIKFDRLFMRDEEN